MTDATDTTPKSRKPRKPSDKEQFTVRVSPEMANEIQEYMENLSPSMRAKVDAASLLEDGPHKEWRQAFLAFAIREALKKTEPTTSRTFGTKIDEFVESVMASNLEAHEQFPDDWWRLTAIGTSMLRDAGHNPVSVKRWMEENAGKVAEHHDAIGIVDPASHNRKAGKARKVAQP